MGGSVGSTSDDSTQLLPFIISSKQIQEFLAVNIGGRTEAR